ncbi:MAG: amidohydrolase family protein [Armatimonadetes bacterium]|nr:amidohydrolase family protein [Armatimonadota bacterium]MCX7967984.1 amidohydrolase family protein [Armatimonadota bacterium]MDW8142402.1 amidohydrolase family protein [Armatimonadota bacterium]
MAAQVGLPIVDCNTWVGFYPRQAIDLSPQVLLTLMRRYGVARALFVHTTAVFYDFKTGNDLAFQVAMESGGFLLPVATLNPLQYRGMTGEVERRLQQGFRLFRFFPKWQGWKPTIAPFRELVSFLSEKGVPFLIDCPQVGWATVIADLASQIQLPIILSDVTEENLGEVLCVVKSVNNLHLETSCVTQPDGYDLVAAEVGVDKLVFGSGAPLHYFASALFPLLHSGLSDEDKRKVLVENLRRIVQA